MSTENDNTETNEQPRQAVPMIPPAQPPIQNDDFVVEPEEVAAPAPPTDVIADLPKKTIETVAEVPVSDRNAQNLWIDGALSTPNDPPVQFAIGLPSDTDKRTKEFLDKAPNIELMKSVEGGEWARVIKESLGMVTFGDTFSRTLENPEAEFHQTLELNGTRFGSHEARFKEKRNSKFSGELAVIRTISHLGLGSIYNTGLYNTGLWASFKPPAEDALVELYRQLTADKIEMGRSSYGLVYANSTSYTTARLAKFAMEHLYRVHADPNEITPNNALSYISVLDINSLLWGMACTMFPRGFAYTRACTANPEKCQHVVNETLNLRKLQWVDRRALTPKQKAHMAENRQAVTMTGKDLKTYQSDMVRASSHRVTIREGQPDEIAFNLRAPSIQEYIDTGHRWIEDMVNTVDQALGDTDDTAERNRLVGQHTRATVMRQYSHWVSSIEYESNTIDERDTIEEVLSAISGDKEVRQGFLQGVSRFIETASVAVIGIPTYDCPACGAVNESQLVYPHKSTIIPLDVMQLFFVLLTQKHRDLANR